VPPEGFPDFAPGVDELRGAGSLRTVVVAFTANLLVAIA
jgi:hypothetical protein